MEKQNKKDTLKYVVALLIAFAGLGAVFLAFNIKREDSIPILLIVGGIIAMVLGALVMSDVTRRYLVFSSPVVKAMLRYAEKYSRNRIRYNATTVGEALNECMEDVMGVRIHESCSEYDKAFQHAYILSNGTEIMFFMSFAAAGAEDSVVDIRAKIADIIPIFEADEERCDQVLRELVKNAEKNERVACRAY